MNIDEHFQIFSGFRSEKSGCSMCLCYWVVCWANLSFSNGIIWLLLELEPYTVYTFLLRKLELHTLRTCETIWSGMHFVPLLNFALAHLLPSGVLEKFVLYTFFCF